MKPNILRSLFTAAALAPLLIGCASAPMTGGAPVQFNGDTLVNKAGMTLYAYDKNAGGKSACTGQCTTNWPPLMAAATDKGGNDFSVIAREDGARQWAYDGKPLYTWSKDQKPGDMTGDNFNKVWHAVKKLAPIQQPGGGGY